VHKGIEKGLGERYRSRRVAGGERGLEEGGTGRKGRWAQRKKRLGETRLENSSMGGVAGRFSRNHSKKRKESNGGRGISSGCVNLQSVVRQVKIHGKRRVRPLDWKEGGENDTSIQWRELQNYIGGGRVGPRQGRDTTLSGGKNSQGNREPSKTACAAEGARGRGKSPTRWLVGSLPRKSPL